MEEDVHAKNDPCGKQQRVESRSHSVVGGGQPREEEWDESAETKELDESREKMVARKQPLHHFLRELAELLIHQTV